MTPRPQTGALALGDASEQRSPFIHRSAAVGAGPAPARFRLSMVQADRWPHLQAWAGELSRREVPAPSADGGAADLTLPELRLAPSGAVAVDDGVLTVLCAFTLDAHRPDAEVALWKLPGHRFIELNERGPETLARRAPYLMPHLQRLGYQVALGASNRFASPRVLVAFLRAQVCYLLAGGSPASLAATLRDGGYLQTGAELLVALEVLTTARVLLAHDAGQPGEVVEAVRCLARAPEPGEREANGEVDPALIAAVELELLSTAIELTEEGHPPPSVDLAARELAGSPSRPGSLCTRLTPATAPAVLELLARRPTLVSDRAEARVRRWIERGHPFYP